MSDSHNFNFKKRKKFKPSFEPQGYCANITFGQGSKYSEVYFKSEVALEQGDVLFDVTVFMALLKQTFIMNSKDFMNKTGYKVLYKNKTLARPDELRKLNGLGDYKWLKSVSKISSTPDRLLTGRMRAYDRYSGETKVKTHLFVKKPTILWHIADNFFYNNKNFVSIDEKQIRRLFMQLVLKMRPSSIKIKYLRTTPSLFDDVEF